jgi:hypothetical protein
VLVKAWCSFGALVYLFHESVPRARWCSVSEDMHDFFSLWRYSPNLGHGLPPWNSLFHFGLLDFRHSVRLLGRVNISSQGLYLYTHKYRTSMPWVGFELTIPASERAKTVHASDRSATMTGIWTD